jgi:hypothetical protein
MIETSMQLTISSRRDIAVLQKESSALEGEEDVKSVFYVGSSHAHIRARPRPGQFEFTIGDRNERTMAPKGISHDHTQHHCQ